MYDEFLRYCDNLPSIPAVDLTRFIGADFDLRMLLCVPYGITIGIADGKVTDFETGYVKAPEHRSDWHLAGWLLNLKMPF